MRVYGSSNHISAEYGRLKLETAVLNLVALKVLVFQAWALCFIRLFPASFTPGTQKPTREIVLPGLVLGLEAHMFNQNAGVYATRFST